MNPKCVMQVRTYDVVPISPSLGMVAFVPGTKLLKALLTDPTLVSPEAVAAADNRYSTFILTKGGNLERAGQLHTASTHSALSCVGRCSHRAIVPICARAAARLPNCVSRAFCKLCAWMLLSQHQAHLPQSIVGPSAKNARFSHHALNNTYRQ